jgi:hypothetical protein
VDHILMSEYKEHNVNADPILVLPCGHFFATSTLDGHLGMDEVYYRSSLDSIEYSALKSLRDAGINEKPRTCPSCREVVHSLFRYGRIFRLSELRGLERKHMMFVDQQLQINYQRFEKVDKPSQERLIKSLRELEKRINNGPMRKVYEACASEHGCIEVPRPPPMQLIRTLDLLGRVCAAASETFGDEKEEMAVDSFQRAIDLANESNSVNLGARVRLQLVVVLTRRTNFEETVRKRAMEHLDWIINWEHIIPDLVKQAKEVKTSILNPIREIVDVMNAVSKAETGYDYGTSWSDHWYECRNGHPYYIGNCGGAMEVSTCIECGERVGGSHHTVDTSNRRVAGVYAEAMRSRN